MGFNKDRAIVAQNSATAAAAVVASLVAAGLTDDVLGTFDEVRTHIFEGSLTLADGVIEGYVDSSPRKSWAGKKSSGGGGQQANDSGAGVSLKFGKYQGQTIAEVYEADADYITWLAETSNNDFIKAKANEFLASVA